MTDLVLIYPYFDPPRNRSLFRFSPLGLGYIASYLREKGYSTRIVDCTFLTCDEALRRVRTLEPSVIGIYSMFTMKAQALRFAEALRQDCDLVICGGPLPTTDPPSFLDFFDVVVTGEGEETVCELMGAHKNGEAFSEIEGLVYREHQGAVSRARHGENGRIV